MDFDPVVLARWQFAFTISFHIIFPAFTIGLSAYIATLEVLWGWTGHDRYSRLAGTKDAAVSDSLPAQPTTSDSDVPGHSHAKQGLAKLAVGAVGLIGLAIISWRMDVVPKAPKWMPPPPPNVPPLPGS